MSPSLDIPFEYWIEHVPFGLLYVTFSFFTRRRRGVPGFPTVCTYGIRYHGLTLTTCMLVHFFGNQVWTYTGFVICTYLNIQIKICAEYRDMLPRPRLVCQEPGLILICFIAYIFQFSISLWVWLGTLQNCHHAQCPLPLFIVIRMRLLSAHQTIKSPSMPYWGAAGRNTLWHSWHRTGEISR